MKIRNPFNWNLRFGTIPSEFSEAMTYEEQVMWLYYQIKELKEGSANYNYELLENKPSIDGVILSGNVTKTQLGIEQNYSILTNKPKINNVELLGNKSLNELGIQGKLIAGAGIRISGNTISVIGGSGGTSDYELLENLPSINGHELIGDKSALELGLQESLAVDYSQYATSGKYYDMTNIQIGDTISTPISLSTQADRDCIVIENKVAGMHFDLYGKYEVLVTNASNEVVSMFSTEGEAEHGYVEALTDGGYIIINFDNQLYSCNLLFDSSYVENLVKSALPKLLSSDIILLAGGIIGIDSGYYYFDDSYGLYFHQKQSQNLIYGYNDGIFYFDNVSQTFYLDNKTYYYDDNEMDWTIVEHSNITNEIVNSRSKIPTSQAVYQALQNLEPSSDTIFTKLSSNLVLVDGTLPTLDEGWYFTDEYRVQINSNNFILANTFFYVDNIYNGDVLEDVQIYGLGIRKGFNSKQNVVTCAYYNGDTNEWTTKEINVVSSLTGSGITDDDVPNVYGVSQALNSKIDTSAIASSLSSLSTNSEVAGAKAVYDSIYQEDITSQLSYTMETGITMASFSATKVGGLIVISFTATYTSTSNKYFDLFTLDNISNAITTSGYGRTYDQPAGTTVLIAGCQIAGSTGKVSAFTMGQSKGFIGTIITPAFTITT